MKTFSIKSKQITKNWLLIDADKAILGRLAVISANILRGKNKPEYTPNQDCGDNLIIINSKKETDKYYYSHTGYPGGLKEINVSKMREKNKSSDIIKLAIKRMIPKGPLGRQQLSNCKIYSGPDHSHQAQNPTQLDIYKLNRKNIFNKW